MNLVVDGIDGQGFFTGDGEEAPFVIFNVDLQKNIAGPYGSRIEAEAAMAQIYGGATPIMNEQALNDILGVMDNA